MITVYKILCYIHYKMQIIRYFLNTYHEPSVVWML